MEKEQDAPNDAESEMTMDELEEETRNKRNGKTDGMKEKESITQIEYKKECDESPGMMSDEGRKKRKKMEDSFEWGAAIDVTVITGLRQDEEMDKTVMEEDLGKVDMITKYAKEIHEYRKETDEIEKVAIAAQQISKEEWYRLRRVHDNIERGAKKLMIYTARERMNTSKKEEMKEEMREMKKEIEELKEKNIELEKEIARLRDTNMNMTQRQPERHTNYAEALKTPTRQQTSTPKENIEVNRILESIEELRVKVMKLYNKDKGETDIEKENRSRTQSKTNQENMREEEWEVVGEKRRTNETRNIEKNKGQRNEIRTRVQMEAMVEKNKGQRNEIRTRVQTEALVIKCDRKDKTSLELLHRARKDISLDELGIENVRTRRTATGDTLVQVSGENRKEETYRLKQRLKDYFGDAQIKISQPVRMTEMIVWGLEESTTEEEVKEALGEICEENTEQIKVGKIRWSRVGSGSAWVSCPMTMAVKILEKEKILIAWTRIRVEKLPPRQLQCYRCLEGGHTADTCGSTVVRAGSCFRCGSNTHKAKDCLNPVKCAACSSLGIEDKHKIGGLGCNAHIERRKRTEKEIRKPEEDKQMEVCDEEAVADNAEGKG